MELYGDNGKEDGNYYSRLGLFRVVFCGNIGIMGTKMETTPRFLGA